VNGLQKSSAGKTSATTIDATKPAMKETLNKLGFETHGLVVRNRAGKIIHKESGHKFGLLSIDGWVTAAKDSNE
jgi:hypothetical protein